MLSLAIAATRGEFALQAELDLPIGVTGLFGRSGAGKSTLLDAIAGLAPASGRIVLAGETLVDSARGICLPPHRRRVGMVFQDGRLFPHRTVLGNLLYAHRPHDATAVAEMIALLELETLLTRRPAQLSGGERQRVALGRTLLAAPRALLLDEPLAALDRGLRTQILPFLRRVRDRLRIPIVHVSHDLGEILALTDRLVLLDGGRVAGQGPLLTLAANPATLPLLHDLGLANVWQAEVLAPGDGDGSRLRVGPTELRGPPLAWPAGTTVTVHLRPEEVILADGPLPLASVRNRLAGRVVRLVDTPARCLVVLDVGVPLLADVLPGAARELGLEPGRPVTALFKAQALRCHA